MVSYYRPNSACPRWAWSPAALAAIRSRAADIQTAVIYDHFTPFTLIQLEELGFAGAAKPKNS